MKLSIYLMLLLSGISYAVQPVSDTALASIAGDSSIKRSTLAQFNQPEHASDQTISAQPQQNGVQELVNVTAQHALNSTTQPNAATTGFSLRDMAAVNKFNDDNNPAQLALNETPAYQTVDIMDMLVPFRNVRIEGLRKGALTREFGSELFSYRWEGNLQDIWDANQYYRVDLGGRNNAGELEINNIQGRVVVESEIHCTVYGQWRGC